MPSQEQRRTGAESTRQKPSSHGLLGVAAALLAVVVYLPAMLYGWVWDDSLLVASQGGGAAAEGFHPFASLLYRLEWITGLGNPGLYHGVSIVLHGVATWLVFLLARSVGAASGIAFGAALLFGAHPAHAEAVAYISGRPDLLATLFALASLNLAMSAPVCAPGGCRNWRVWPAYGLFALAALSEEVALVTPFVLVLLDRVAAPPRTWRERRVVYAGYFAVLTATLLARIGAGQISVGPHGEVPEGAAIAAPFFAAYEALRAFVVPWDLNALRSFPDSVVTPGAILWRAALPLLLLALFAGSRRRDPLARAGVVLLLVPLLPALPLPLFAGPYLTERSLYFSSVGFCFLLGSATAGLAERFPNQRRVAMAGSVAVAAIVAVLTLARLPVWRDNVALLQATAVADPGDPKPHVLLAEHYLARNDAAGALASLDRAITIDSTDVDAYHKRTAVLMLLGQFPEAEVAARKSISLDAGDAIGWANLGDALMQQGKTLDAVAACRRAVALDPKNANNWYNLAVAVGDQDLSEAIASYRRVIEIDPQHVRAFNNLGAVLGASGRLEEARDACKRAVELSPGSVECRMNLTLAYLRLGDKAGAAEQQKVIQRLDPKAAERVAELFRDTGATEGAGDPARRP